MQNSTCPALNGWRGPSRYSLSFFIFISYVRVMFLSSFFANRLCKDESERRAAAEEDESHGDERGGGGEDGSGGGGNRVAA